jgi:hypothetical protein
VKSYLSPPFYGITIEIARYVKTMVVATAKIVAAGIKIIFDLETDDFISPYYGIVLDNNWKKNCKKKERNRRFKIC